MQWLALFGLPGIVAMIFVCYVYGEQPSFRFGGPFKKVVREITARNGNPEE